MTDADTSDFTAWLTSHPVVLRILRERTGAAVRVLDNIVEGLCPSLRLLLSRKIAMMSRDDNDIPLPMYSKTYNSDPVTQAQIVALEEQISRLKVRALRRPLAAS